MFAADFWQIFFCQSMVRWDLFNQARGAFNMLGSFNPFLPTKFFFASAAADIICNLHSILNLGCGQHQRRRRRRRRRHWPFPNVAAAVGLAQRSKGRPKRWKNKTLTENSLSDSLAQQPTLSFSPLSLRLLFCLFLHSGGAHFFSLFDLCDHCECVHAARSLGCWLGANTKKGSNSSFETIFSLFSSERVRLWRQGCLLRKGLSLSLSLSLSHTHTHTHACTHSIVQCFPSFCESMLR